MRKISQLLVLLVATSAGAQSFLYPVPWPKAGGGMLVAVPLADSKVTVFRMVGSPHLAAFDKPFSLVTPELSLPQAPRDQPIILFAPDLATAPNADRDDIFMISSDHRLVLSIADDERSQPGSPDRIFFMPADTGTFKGRVFYSGANGGDPGERIRVVNFGAAPSATTVFSWSGTAWTQVGAFTVAPGNDVAFDPPTAQAAYKVITSEDSMVVVGYIVDNASAPAADTSTGLPVGTELNGYGNTWHLRAVTALSYVVETRPSGSTNWTQASSGTLAADESAGAVVSSVSMDSWVRIRISGGRGWAITGDPSLLTTNEWNGYFLPTQEPDYCTVGTKFFTSGSARTITMLPRPGTTVTSYDADSGVVVDSYTSTGPWEFHNAFHAAQARVEVTNGPGSVLLVGTLNWGGCEESMYPGNCGILEGGYSLAGLSAFRCGSDITNANCQITAEASCRPLLPDGGVQVSDAGTADAGSADAGEVDAGGSGGGGGAGGSGGTGGTGGSGGSGGTGGTGGGGAIESPDAGGSTITTGGTHGCGCTTGAGELQVLAMLLLAAANRRKRS